MAEGGTSGMAVTPPLALSGNGNPRPEEGPPIAGTALRPLSEGVLWRGVVPQSWDVDDPLRGSHTSSDG